MDKNRKPLIKKSSLVIPFFSFLECTVLLLVISLVMNEWLGASELEDTGSCDIRDKFSSAFLLLLEGRRRLNDTLNMSKLRMFFLFFYMKPS